MREYKLRPIMIKDLHLLLQWRNSERIHSMMLTDHKITWKEHLTWFHRIETDTIKRNFVFEYRGCPIGYVGYTEYDSKRRVCSPGAYLGEINVPIDAGIYLFYMTLEYAFSELNMCRVETSIFKRNKKARRINEIFGYKVIPGIQLNYMKHGKREIVIRIAMTRAEWNTNKHVINLEG